MSLLLWLPLNNEINNQGLLALPSFSFNGFVREEGGKIGKYCYIDGAVTHFSEDFLDNKWTIACWVKSTEWSAYNDIILCKNEKSSDLCQFYLSVINGTSFNLGINGGSNNGAGGFNYTFSTNTWYHLAATYDGTKYAMYINGNKVKSGTCTTAKPNGLLNLGFGCRSGNSGGTSTTGNNQKRLNDIRIYDHALSLKEIKEISKGLVLHYPLNREGIGQNNIIKNSDKGIGFISSDYGSMTTHNFDSATGIGRIEIISDTGCWNRWRFGKNDLETNPVELTSGVTTYTFSSDIRVTNYITGTIALTFDFRTNNVVHSTAQCILTNVETDGQWHRVSASLTTNKQNDTECLFCITSKGTVGNIGMVVEYKHFKLEMGSIATPWCPNSSDELATALGLNNNVIYDASGLSNDGISNNILADSSTSRYICSAAFNGTNSYIKVTNFDWISQYPQELTVSIWGYADNWATQTDGRLWSCTESGGFNIEAGASGYWRFPVYCSTKSDNSSHAYVYKNDALKLSDLSSGWHMITWVYTTANQKVYIDGELYSTYTYQTYGIRFNKNAHLFLGCEANSASPSSPYFNGNLSDFRVYVTALPEQDIKNLYEVAASADADNNYYVYSYNELTQNREIEYLYDLHKVNSSGTGTFTQNKNGLNLNNKIWVYHDYVSINPTGKTYKYDITYSCDAGNQFYIGWQRYDANKTSRSNSACVYVISTKPSTDVVTNRVKGTVDLSTDGVNPCAFIKLRILNKWTGSDSNTQGKATIHSLSLKEYSNDNVLTPLNHTKQGTVNTTEIIESDIGVSINDTYELKSNNFYEI